MRVGIAAAGSGGHLYPALAVADSLVALGLEKSDVVFFGGDRMETELVPRAGYPFVQVDVHGIRRSLSLDNFKLPLKIIRATRVVTDEIKSRDLEAMIVFGGYVSGPAGLAARRRGIPLIVHEANARPGVANRLIAPFADTVFVAFEPAVEKLRGAVVVGNPLRVAFDSFDKVAAVHGARERFGLGRDAVVLGVFGGSLGAAAINSVARELASISDRGYEILHIAGELHYEQLAGEAATVDGWRVLPFESEMEHFYAACDLVISRSGAITVSELHATATPSILVPLPAGNQYQGLNATDLVNSGGGIVIDQNRRGEIIATANDLLSNERARTKMSETSAKSQNHGVSRLIAQHVLEVAGG